MFFLNSRQGIRHGDTVALFVDNRLEFIALWLGLARIGALSALLNFNLTKDALVHCIKVSEAKSVVFVGRLKPGKKQKLRFDFFIKTKTCSY